MDIKLQGEISKKGVKVKVESDEMAVKLGKTNLSSVQTTVKLKALFEELVTCLRNGTPSPSFPTLPHTVEKIVPQCPPLMNQHPILQTLLKLVWETHITRYREIVFTFEEAIHMKVENTRRICDFTSSLEVDKESLVQKLHETSIAELKKEFRGLWAEKLVVIQDLLETQSADVSELLELLIQKATKELSIDVETLEAPVDKALGLFRQDFLVKSDQLWKEWSLQLERHKSVLKGNLTAVNSIDDQLRKSTTASSAEPKHQETDEAFDETEFAYKDMILLLSSMKLDFEIRLTSLSKLKQFLSSKLQESKQRALAKLITETLVQEEKELEASKEKLQNQLNDVKLSQDRVLRELSLACNNSLAPVETILKNMQLTIDLNLETARERTYTEAMKKLKEISLNKFVVVQEKK